uniref:DOPA 4,5-dioxygenase family protein n=1 Tax=Marinobacterium profundum TaxID=1714300 RepID=UPI00082C56B1|nr:DOPA 4,5-dioxygenase family protein [Marinobacterium profundum]
MTPAKAFHAHVYFDAQTQQQATELCQQAGEALGLRVGRVHCKPVGPHPRWSCQLSDSIDNFGTTLTWLAQHRNGLTIFCHLVTDDDLKDHTDHAIWMGAMLPLDLSIFQ